MFVTTLATLSARSRVELITGEDDPNEVSIQIRTDIEDPGAFSQIVLALPSDDEQALLLLDLLDAAVDNAVSAVRLRQMEHERGVSLAQRIEDHNAMMATGLHECISSCPPYGAGASVESYRVDALALLDEVEADR